MIELVYFGNEHRERAGDAVGSVYNSADKEWITPLQVVEAIKLRMAVSIRPATETEMKRMHEHVALYEIGRQLEIKVGHLLDRDAAHIPVEQTERQA